ncbi:hypothetical protein Salat_1256200 [Sesamum alatum]|uniref:Uncharacterized protein n=1 Tax=Sesamum alatum TaxID=300844 RepID=A0AAE1YGP0_9LAMI|nr:hypothetical protein Salat_1256200 [Sesamum alatum]
MARSTLAVGILKFECSTSEICDYFQLLSRTGGSCSSAVFSGETLQAFAMSQVHRSITYLEIIRYGDRYPTHAHHRGAPIPGDRKQHSSSEGSAYLNSKVKIQINLWEPWWEDWTIETNPGSQSRVSQAMLV